MARRPTRNQKREIERITKGLTAGGLKVGPVKFDPVTGELIFSTVNQKGERCDVSSSHWDDFIKHKQEQAKRENPH